jgi:hypothetical protein
VSNPFRCVGSGSAGSIIEALHMNGFVLGGTAVVSRFVERPCVVGKSIFLRRSALEWIGGFETVGDHLAEDFLLGDLISAAGFRVVLSPCFVTVVSSGRTIRAILGPAGALGAHAEAGWRAPPISRRLSRRRYRGRSRSHASEDGGASPWRSPWPARRSPPTVFCFDASVSPARAPAFRSGSP